MKTKIKYDLTLEELKEHLKIQGVKLKPSYHHEDYMFTSFTLPYDLKDKLDSLHKNLKMSRSKFLQLVIRHIDEKKFKELCLGDINEKY